MRLDQEVRLGRQIDQQAAAVGAIEIQSYGAFSGLIGQKVQRVIGTGSVVQKGRDTPRGASLRAARP